jgi:hypothetical protein
VAFRQYTRCIDAAVYSSRVRYVTIAALLAGTPAAMIAIAMGHPACLLIALEITTLAGAVAYYHNWLYHRLICLGGDRDCIGAIVSIGGPVELGLNFFDRDTDYSINLLLKNTNYGPSVDGLSDDEIKAARAALKMASEQSAPYGELVTPQPSVTAIGLEFGGHFATDGDPGSSDGHTHQLAAVLHAEFEGDGNYKMLQASKVLLAVAIYSLIACIFLPWPADIILAAIIGLLTLLGLFIASLLGGFGEGSPTDVNAGDLTDNTDVVDGHGIGADIVYVQGSWVCDTLHERWNEIHPIKTCMKCGKWDGGWPPDDIILRLRHGFQLARDEGTKINQARPENQWIVHPSLDGCTPDGPIT